MNYKEEICGQEQAGRNEMGHEKLKKKSQSSNMAALRYAFPKTAPVMAGYLVLGAAYGILMSEKGFGIWWPLIISVFVYAGSLQYLGITFFVALVNPWYAFFMSLMLNARHLFYGISMLDKYREAGNLKPYLIFSLTDETFSVLCNEEPPKDIPKYMVYFFVSLLDHIYWSVGAFLGAIAGTMISFDTAGMDFALTALFVVIFVDQWKSGKGHWSALAGVFASALCLKVFGQSGFIIPAMIAILGLITSAYYMEKRKEKQS